MTNHRDARNDAPGNVFKSKREPPARWPGRTLALAINTTSWGVRGFNHAVKSHEKLSAAKLWLDCNKIDCVGNASLYLPEIPEEAP